MTKKTKLRITLIIILLGLIALSIYSWDKTEKDYKKLEPIADSAIPVEFVSVNIKKINDWIYSEGTARANKKAHLTFEVDGRVEEIINIAGIEVAKEGIMVNSKDKNGNKQLLAKLYDKDYSEELLIAKSTKIQAERDVDVARAAIKQAESRLTLANLKFKRLDHLFNTKTVSRQKHDEAKSILDVAKSAVLSARAEEASKVAALQAAENSLSQAERNFSRTRIYSPWSGTIARVNIEKDKYFSVDSLDITDSDTMTATFPITIIDCSIFKISVEIPMNRIEGLTPGNTAYIRRHTTISNEQEHKAEWIPAEVFTVAPILSPKSKTVRVTLKTTTERPKLIDGELVQSKILKTSKKALVIPITALLYSNNQTYVFVINTSTSKVSKRKITTGIRSDLYTEVTSGLTAGEKVVTSGRQRLKNTSTIRLLENKSNE